MTIGTGTFVPHPQYRFPRSYVYQIDIARYGCTLTRTFARFTIHAVPPDPTIAVIQLANNWWLWNSNYRTLDHIVTEFWAKPGGVGPEVPINFTLGWWMHPVTGLPGLFFNWFSGPRDEQIFNLPKQPLNYWLPSPL